MQHQATLFFKHNHFCKVFFAEKVMNSFMLLQHQNAGYRAYICVYKADIGRSQPKQSHGVSEVRVGLVPVTQRAPFKTKIYLYVVRSYTSCSF